MLVTGTSDGAAKTRDGVAQAGRLDNGRTFVFLGAGVGILGVCCEHTREPARETGVHVCETVASRLVSRYPFLGGLDSGKIAESGNFALCCSRWVGFSERSGRQGRRVVLERYAGRLGRDGSESFVVFGRLNHGSRRHLVKSTVDSLWRLRDRADDVSRRCIRLTSHC